jgi:hypothetical protein
MLPSMIPEVLTLRIMRGQRPATIRLMFGTLYLLATLLAGLVHVRDCCAVVEAQAGCCDPGAHWASHRQAPDLSAEHDHDCVLCQSRAVHHPWEFAGTEQPVARGQADREDLPPPHPLTRLDSSRTRGPPELG